MDRLALLSDTSISKGEISVKSNNSIKGNGLDRKFVQRKDTTPSPIKEELNRLAKAWCELLLGQVMEAHNQQKLLRANGGKTAENINIDNKRGSALSRQEPLSESSGCPLT
ncbi:hypothetical protein A3D79_02310 [Candidatus Daviesbacteria bacterium RIFCSPHIGHO2_02_FULL_39_8]|nr:MAG: hypothetical protein A3D79_02310 [Candidatus Daviesbacteria bacterium RIFCSPHIGHO2_02_FULL_39_8]